MKALLLGSLLSSSASSSSTLKATTAGFACFRDMVGLEGRCRSLSISVSGPAPARKERPGLKGERKRTPGAGAPGVPVELGNDSPAAARLLTLGEGHLGGDVVLVLL